MILFLSTLALLSLITIIFMMGGRVRRLRAGETFIFHRESLYDQLMPHIDTLATMLVSACGRAGHYLYGEAVLRSHRWLTVIKHFVGRVEGEFAHIADSVRGRGHISKGGSVSFFLKEIGGDK
jgi:hypothetical protein